jgi:tetratricopeptide (TPR) repeat protein
VDAALSHPEPALSTARTVQKQLDRGSVDSIDPAFLDTVRNGDNYVIASMQSDYQSAARLAREGVNLARNSSLTGRDVSQNDLLYSLALLHDGTGMRAYWEDLPPPETPTDSAHRLVARVLAEGALEHYQSVIAFEPDAEKTASAVGESFIVKDTFERRLRPTLAMAKAKLGDLAGAQALIASSPLDCYDCLRMRALIAETANQPARADDWFARAVHDAPSIPRAYADWGQALLERGQPDAAIEKFKQANERGAHFADPLEYWGEALMAKNQSHLAVAKFAEAEKYAPNWGRLHLKWGEALYYSGRRDDAKTQFARAIQLDLSPSEKSELARVNHV